MTCDIRIGLSRSNGFRTSIVSQVKKRFTHLVIPRRQRPCRRARQNSPIVGCPRLTWVVVAVRAMGFPYPLRLPPLRLRDQVLQPDLVPRCAAAAGFPRCHELLISCVVQSLCKLQCVAGGFTLYHVLQQMEKLVAVRWSFSGNCLLLNVFCHRE